MSRPPRHQDSSFSSIPFLVHTNTDVFENIVFSVPLLNKNITCGHSFRFLPTWSWAPSDRELRLVLRHTGAEMNEFRLRLAGYDWICPVWDEIMHHNWLWKKQEQTEQLITTRYTPLHISNINTYTLHTTHLRWEYSSDEIHQERLSYLSHS